MKKRFTLITIAAMMSMTSVPAFAESDTGIWPEIAGEEGTTYANLFEVILDEQYDSIWEECSAAVVGEENVEAAVEMMKGYISSDLYGQEAIDAFAEGGYAFDCWYIQDVDTFTFEGQDVTILKTDGSTETHTYEYLGVYNVGEGESMIYNGEEFPVTFACDVYQSTEEAGEFNYFFLRDDTMEETYHIEFRYGSDLEDLQGYFVGPYAYWLAAGIDAEADEDTIYDVIELFCTENLSGE